MYKRQSLPIGRDAVLTPAIEVGLSRPLVIPSEAGFVLGGTLSFSFGSPNGTGGARSGANELFENQLPERLRGELAAAERLGVSPAKAGTPEFQKLLDSNESLKFVVTKEGELVLGPHSVAGEEISHAVLSGGRPVRTAGEVEVAASGGQRVGLEIAEHSGHFQPSPESLQAARDAFAQHGIHFPE